MLFHQKYFFLISQRKLLFHKKSYFTKKLSLYFLFDTKCRSPIDKNNHWPPSPRSSAESAEASHLLESFLCHFHLVIDVVQTLLDVVQLLCDCCCYCFVIDSVQTLLNCYCYCFVLILSIPTPLTSNCIARVMAVTG